MSTLDERIAQARVEVAKAVIASPHVYPAWGRLHSAADRLSVAQLEYNAALASWRHLIEDAPPEWAKLAPPIPGPRWRDGG